MLHAFPKVFMFPCAGVTAYAGPDQSWFMQVLDLVPLVDNVTKLTASCAFCEQQALFSLRIAADQRQEVVGGADKYAPVCRHHFSNFERLRSEQYADAVVE